QRQGAVQAMGDEIEIAAQPGRDPDPVRRLGDIQQGAVDIEKQCPVAARRRWRFGRQSGFFRDCGFDHRPDLARTGPVNAWGTPIFSVFRENGVFCPDYNPESGHSANTLANKPLRPMAAADRLRTGRTGTARTITIANGAVE